MKHYLNLQSGAAGHSGKFALGQGAVSVVLYV